MSVTKVIEPVEVSIVDAVGMMIVEVLRSVKCRDTELVGDGEDNDVVTKLASEELDKLLLLDALGDGGGDGDTKGKDCVWLVTDDVVTVALL